MGGVCGGLADYLNVDVVVPRIIAVALLFSGSGFLLYLIAWIVIPEEPEPADRAEGLSMPLGRTEPAPRAMDAERGRWLLGGLLVAVGGWFMIRNIADSVVPWLDELILPMALIAIGSAVVVYSMKK